MTRKVALSQIASLLLASGLVSSQTAIPVYLSGSTPAGCALTYSAAPNIFTCVVPGAGSLPTGSILMITSGTCPAGFSEVVALDGVSVRGTLAAHSDVGTTTGSDTATPSGSVSAPSFTGNSVTSSAVSAGTPAGTNGTGTVTPSGTVAWPVGVPTNASGAFAEGAISWPVGVPTQAVDTFGTTKFTTSGSGTAAFTSETSAGAISWPAGVPTIAAGVFTQPTISWPAGVPTFSGSSSTTSAETFTGSALGTHTHTTTATGTNGTPTFTGNALATVPASLKVIFCSKN